MGEIPTVKVVHGDSYMIINESDYDPEVHELYKEKPAGKAKDAPTEKTEEPKETKEALGDEGGEKQEETGKKEEEGKLPEGYEVEAAGHGWFYAKVGGEYLQKADSDKPKKFRGESAAVEALKEHAAGQKE